MTAPADLAVQKAIYTALHAALGALTPAVPVYDHVPQGATFPYVTIGEDVIVDWDTKPTAADSGVGIDATVVIHTWSRYPGMTEAKTIMGAVKTALNNVDLSIEGQSICLCRFEYATSFMDEDGVTRHGVQHFRLLASDHA